MIPNWIKKLYEDSGTKWLTSFLLIGGPLFQIASYFVNDVWDWEVILLTYGFYLFIFLPIAYWQRNTK